MTSRRRAPRSVISNGMAAHVTVDEFRELEKRVDVHDVRLAVQDNNQATMQKTLDAVVAEMSKTRWTLIGFAFTVAGSAAAVIGLG